MKVGASPSLSLGRERWRKCAWNGREESSGASVPACDSLAGAASTEGLRHYLPDRWNGRARLLPSVRGTGLRLRAAEPETHLGSMAPFVLHHHQS